MRRPVFSIAILIVLGVVTQGVVQARLSGYVFPAGEQVLIQSGLGAAWLPHLQLVGGEWDEKSGPLLFSYTNGTQGCDPSTSLANLPRKRIIICWSALRPGYTATAQNYYEDGEIRNCRIRIDTDFASGRFYPIMSHEIGHCVGLEHVDCDFCIMHPKLHPMDFPVEYDGNSLRLAYDLPVNTGGQSFTASNND